MKKKHSTKRLFNLTGYDNRYKATVQILGEVFGKGKDKPGNFVQDSIRWAIEQAAARCGITPEQIAARAAELDAQDKAKAGAE
jgi:hypothetical protein